MEDRPIKETVISVQEIAHAIRRIANQYFDARMSSKLSRSSWFQAAYLI
jgi:hypothetical protein